MTEHAHVLQRDANSVELLDQIAAIVPGDALAVCSATPTGLVPATCQGADGLLLPVILVFVTLLSRRVTLLGGLA